VTCPRDPVAAVTHPDPSSYYALLAARQPFYRDENLGLWVAAGAGPVAEVLASPVCHVRPVHEPVPNAIAGTPAAEIFRHLVRMRDDPKRTALKAAIVKALAMVEPRDAMEASATLAAQLAADLSEEKPDLAGFAFSLPVQVVARLLGFLDEALTSVATSLTLFVAGLSPLAGTQTVEASIEAASDLMAEMRAHLASDGRHSAFCRTLIAEAERAGCHDADEIAANAIGLMMQAQEATAGLIGNVLVRLCRDPSLRLAVSRDAASLASIIQEVLWRDLPIQNTRRYVARETVIAGQALKPGEGILVILAAAQQDADASGRGMLAFGEGRHACPARNLASAIAEAGVARLLDRDGLADMALPVYRRSVNARIPF